MAALLLFLLAPTRTPDHVLLDKSLFHAPVVNTTPPTNVDATSTPVVFMHGMGDAAENPGMQSLVQSVTTMYPQKYSVAIPVGDGLASIIAPLDVQVAAFAQAVRRDPRLQGGFDAVGLSQGSLIVRGYVERFNDPPVRTFVSICGPMEGVADCPRNPVYEAVCPVWRIDPWVANISFSSYWKNPADRTDYLKHNTFLPDVNNELSPNPFYRKNMETLSAYVLVMGTSDSMLVPRETALHGFYAWGTSKDIVPMQKSEGYVKNWVGLQSLDKSGKIHTLTFTGDHLRFSSSWWQREILPRFV